MLGKVFARFVEKSPIAVMVRGTLERVLGADQLDAWFARTAQKQYTRTVLFSALIMASATPALSVRGQSPSTPEGRGIRGLRCHAECPKVADTVIEALFSTVYALLSQVVFRIKPSVRAAYRDREDEVGASLIAVYNKLKGLETHTSAELVR
jgi:hypothetical protein